MAAPPKAKTYVLKENYKQFKPRTEVTQVKQTGERKEFKQPAARKGTMLRQDTKKILRAEFDRAVKPALDKQGVKSKGRINPNDYEWKHVGGTMQKPNMIGKPKKSK